MDLERLVSETLAGLVEGGKALGGEPVPRELVGPTLAAFEKQVLAHIPHRSAKPIGSTGKKAQSGDLDVGLDTHLDPRQVAEIVGELGFERKLNVGLGEVSVLFPQHDASGMRTPRWAQIDLMVAPEDWTQWQYYGPGDQESKYRGVHVRGITNAIFSVVGGMSISPNRGIFRKDDPKKEYSRDVQKAVDHINISSDTHWTPEDFRQPFEKIWDKVKESFDPQTVQKIREYFVGFMKSTKQPVPPEVNEGIAYNKVQPFYGPKGGAQVAQGNIGGPRNRGVPGYPVPPEMMHRRGGRGPDDGRGFDIQEDSQFSAWNRLQDIILGTTKVKAIRAIPPEKFKNGGLAAYIPDYRMIVYSGAAQDPWRLYAVAHEAGHAMGTEDERQAWENGQQILKRAGIRFDKSGNQRKEKSIQMHEAVDPKELQKGIPHLDDLKPEQFLAFLKKFADEPLRLEISEKVDGSARISFGRGAGHIWTQSKNGTRKARSDQYPDTPMYRAIRAAHRALEQGAQQILASWPDNVAFFVAEVLYTRVPNSIEYGPNVLMIHGVHTEDGKTVGDADAKRLAGQVITPTGGKLSDGKDPWLFEYKRTVDPKEVWVDVRKEYDTLGQLYQDLAAKPRDTKLKADFQKIQKAVKEKLIKMLHQQRSAYGPEGGDVEGLVFRDLDSGQMVKLVDKDFFTQLNGFLWQFRKALDRDVMQSFRKVVADKVLGDSVAASTSFLKNLVTRYAPKTKGKTPERHADQVLAAYIKDKKLMSGGDFAQEFQGALMGAFAELERLRNEWEKFRKQPQSVKLGPKVRSFSPEHIERTEESFVEAEAALRGIKAGLGVVAGIKHPMTQKVALLKLFMGHKFDKLVSALGGTPGEEQVSEGARTDAFGPVPSHLKNRPEDAEMQRRSMAGLAMAQGADMGAAYEELPVQFFREKLAKRGYNVGKAVGAGAYGTAYELGGGRVLKVTTDADEARASMHLKSKKMKHVAEIFDVFRFPNDPRLKKIPFFGIVLEKVKTISPHSHEGIELSSAIRQFQSITNLEWSDPRESSAALVRYFLQDSGGDPMSKHVLQLLQKFQILEIRDELMKNHVVFTDLHAGNIGQRADGTWVAFDLGSESVAPDAQVPVLEGGPIDRMTGATDLSGSPRVDSVGLDDAARVNEAAQQGTIGATIGRFQPFHAGHAAIIRQLAGQYSSVLVFVAGQRVDKKNPFTHDLRLKMMELSLPDVWSKVKVFPASIQGKGTGYVPGLVANAAASGQAAVPQDGAVDVLVGEDRINDVQKQAQHNAAHSGEPGYYTGTITARALPGVKNDDDAGRISGTAVREALARDDKEAVRRMLDPHLAGSPEFEGVYGELRDQMRASGLIAKVTEAVIAEMSAGAMGTTIGDFHTGRHGSGAWASYNPRHNDKDDPTFTAMLRSPSTRMLQMNNPGTPDNRTPGMDSLDMSPEDEQDASKPTDLGEVVFQVARRLLEKDKKALPRETYVTNGRWERWEKHLTPDQLQSIPFRSNNAVVGPGEERLVAILGGKKEGDASAGFDILDRDGKKWEVKSVSRREDDSGGKKGGDPKAPAKFRFTGYPEMADQWLGTIRVILKQIHNFLGDITPEVEQVLTGEGIPVPRLRKFLEAADETVPSGNIPKGLLTGSSRFGDGLFPAITWLNQYRVKNGLKLGTQTTYSRGEFGKYMQGWTLENELESRLSDVLRLSRQFKWDKSKTDQVVKEVYKELKVEAHEAAMAKLNNIVFRDKAAIKDIQEAWKSVSIKKFLAKADGMILVHETEGFLKIPTAQAERFVEFSEISDRAFTFRIRKHVPGTQTELPGVASQYMSKKPVHDPGASNEPQNVQVLPGQQELPMDSPPHPEQIPLGKGNPPGRVRTGWEVGGTNTAPTDAQKKVRLDKMKRMQKQASKELEPTGTE